MESSARRLPGGEFEETIMPAAGPSAIPAETSSFHTALEEYHLSSSNEIAIGDLGARSSLESKSEYFSARVEKMMQRKNEFSSAEEHEIEHSRVHWSEVTGLSDFLEDKDYEEVNQENEKVFAELIIDPQWKHYSGPEFFFEWPPFRNLGRKIAEGGTSRNL